ncbi:serine-rich adhesin for platelets [Drosophila busckii]|uniref:serine-rich adhesin for platelets n=1 Tax=Drosophila busckii TaxID=30019 RepID=UPI00083ED5A7|nr:serine-rich adhesin for platelets [Drosophila busckii]
MAAINTVSKSIHLPLSGLSTPRVLMCSASVGSEGSVTLQLRDASSLEAADSTTTTTVIPTTTAATTTSLAAAAAGKSTTNGVTALEAAPTAAGGASALENALTIGYPDPEMLADVLGSIQTASLKNNKHNSHSHNNNNNSSKQRRSSHVTTTSSSSISLHNPNKITITRRNASNKISVQTVSTSTNTTISSIGGSKTNYIKNCLIRSSSCSNTATNVTTLAQIMSNSSTSSAASLLNQHNNNSNCSNSSNFSNASSVGSSISIGSNSSNSSNSNSNDSNSSNCGPSSTLSFIKTSNVRNVASVVTTTNSSSSNSSTAATPTSSSTTNGIGIVTVDCAPRKSRPKLSSPTRHGPQQCQICSKIFGNASALAKHKLTHSDERKYICALCSKAFKRQDHLNGHMMTHRNKKPYECKADGCGKSYCDARSLRRHSENHHGGASTPNNNHNSLSPTVSTGNSNSNSSSVGVGTGVANSTHSLSPATASGDASSPDGATCIRTYISTGSSVVDAATGIALSDEQIKAMNLPIKTGVTLLSPTTSTSSNASSSTNASSSSSSSNSTSSSCSSSNCSVNASTSTNNSNMLASSPSHITLSDGATLEGEGLTREQLDLISKIMQQTKQTSAQVTVSSPTSVSSYKINTETTPVQSRPRTWNMQLVSPMPALIKHFNNVKPPQLNNTQAQTQTQNVTVTVEDNSDMGGSASAATSPVEIKEDELSQQLVAAINPHLLNIVKIDKPVECNLCHRKFKNIPALNGHMRLHGGYFKKDPETKRSEKKDSNGPPLQTASIGVRALIEEKIISKRSKDITKGAFVVPAPPSSGNQAILTTNSVSNISSSLRRSISDLENFLNPKSSSSSSCLSQALAASSTTTAVLPAATTIKSTNGLSIQQIGLPQSIEIFSGGQRQSKTLSLGSGANTITITTNNVPTTTTMSALTALKGGGSISSVPSSQVDPKDSTLIELLKRGTRIAVTSKKAQTQTSTNLLLSSVGGTTELTSIGGHVQTGRQIITNNNRTVIIPSDVHVVSTKSTKVSNTSSSSSSSSLSLPDGTPLSLTITPTQESLGVVSEEGSISDSGGGVYTVTYTSNADAADLFDDAEVYNVSDTEMLLQTVDTMELLNADEDDEARKSEHSEDFALLSESGEHLIKLEPDVGTNNNNNNSSNCGSNNRTALPTFQQFHSKELIMQNSSQIQAIASMRASSSSMLGSPMHSPLTYPTPPSSHENMAQSSPFIEDAAAQFVDASHTFFGDKTDFSHVYFKTDEGDPMTHLSENDNEKILKLKTVLEESSFDQSIKVEDLLNGADGDTECDLREFAETNLSFLDEDQEFLNDSRNATSPLSESFFTSGIGSAEDVKEVLREVLPEENMQLTLSEQQGENIIDLYYFPGLGLNSQMMPNSDDPLLSSSPREFGQQRQLLQAAAQTAAATTTAQLQPVQGMEQMQASNLIYQQQQPQPQQQQLLMTQQPELEPQQQQQQQQQQQTDFMLPPFTPVQSNQTHYLDASQQPMTLQPLNNLMQPFYASSNLSQEKQEFATLLTTTSVNQATTLDASMLFTCNSDNNKPLLAAAAAAATPLPVVTPTTTVTNLQPLSNQTNSILKRRLRSNGAQDTHKFSKFHTLSPHRSKLRKPSRTHYTPSPILNPDRKGTGLYCNVRKQLGQGIFDVFDDFSDPVGLVDFSDESKVNLGSTYQAQIPACRLQEESAKDSLNADMMWDPSVQLDEKILMRYIDLSKSSAVPMGSHSEEVALQALLEGKGNSAAAVLTLLQTQSSAFQMKWTASELEQFLRGLEKHGKDFGRIASELRSKSSRECVQMYYFWKKLCVDYKVSHLKMEPVTPITPPVDQKPYVCEIPDCSANLQ